MLKSGILRTLLPEIVKYTFIAVFVCFYNALLVTGYDDLGGLHHEALTSVFPVCKLPADVFSLTTPSLALLLGTSIIIDEEGTIFFKSRMHKLFQKLVVLIPRDCSSFMPDSVFKTNTSYKRWDEGRKVREI